MLSLAAATAVSVPGDDWIGGGAGNDIFVGNSANSNGGWGIWSELPSLTGANIDGGKNRAIGNVELLQCHAVVCDGSMPTERTVLATLGTLEERLHAESVRPPAIIVVGEVVAVAHPDAFDRG